MVHTRLMVAGMMAVMLAVAPAAWCRDEKKAARSIQKDYQDSVVHITAVGKFSSGQGPSRDSKIETTGIVLDPSGLTLVALSSFDPISWMGREGSAKIEFSDVKIKLADGTEIPARLVLKDPELDLAFIQPEEGQAGKAKFTAVPLGKNPEVGILDPVVTLDRLDDSFGREPLIFISRIASIITKPRTVYMADDEGSSVSSPVFTLDGRLLGVHLLRKTQGEDGGAAPVILPVEDIAEIARQVLEKYQKE